MITISRQPARQAQMPAIRQRLAHRRATSADLRSSTRVNLNQQSPGTFSLVRKHVDKGRPSSIIYRLREHARSEPFDVQVLDRNQPVSVHDLTTQLVMKIRSLVANVDRHSPKNLHGLTPSVRTFLSACHAPLCDSQSALIFPVMSCGVYLRSVAQGGKVRQPDINADSVRTEGERLRFNVATEDRIPSARFSLHSQRLDRPFKRSVHVDPHVADSRESESIALKGVPNLPKGNAVIASGRSEAGIAGICPALATAKECPERLIYASDGILKNLAVNCGYVITIFLNVRQLVYLVKPANRLAFKSPRIASFLKGRVVKFAANRKSLFQFYNLRLRGIDAVLKSAYYLVSQSVNLTTRFVLRLGSLTAETVCEPFSLGIIA